MDESLGGWMGGSGWRWELFHWEPQAAAVLQLPEFQDCFQESKQKPPSFVGTSRSDLLVRRADDSFLSCETSADFPRKKKKKGAKCRRGRMPDGDCAAWDLEALHSICAVSLVTAYEETR